MEIFFVFFVRKGKEIFFVKPNLGPGCNQRAVNKSQIKIKAIFRRINLINCFLTYLVKSAFQFSSSAEYIEV